MCVLEAPPDDVGLSLADDLFRLLPAPQTDCGRQDDQRTIGAQSLIELTSSVWHLALAEPFLPQTGR